MPSDPERTTAKPAIRLVTAPNQRLTGSETIGVEALANANGTLVGGIDRVRFHFEGNTLDVVEDTPETFFRKDGSAYSVRGYWANLGRVPGRTGKAHLYIEAIPADATMQSRVIGPFLYSFADSPFDYDIEVAPTPAEITGQRYKTIEAAINWLKAQTPDAARIRITETGTYLYKENATAHTFDNWLLIEAAQGVTATFARSAYIGDADSRFFARSGNVAFRNLTFDMRYVASLQGNSGTVFWADRCTFTSTDPDGSYAKWRGQQRVNGFILEGAAYITDCTIDKLSNPLGAGTALARGNMVEDGYADVGGDVQCMTGNIVSNWNSAPWLIGENAFTITYNGAEATARISAPIAQDDTRVFTASWGSNTDTLTVGRREADWRADDTGFDGATDNAYWPRDIVDWVNGTGTYAGIGLADQDAGWSATLLDDTICAFYVNVSRDDPEFLGGANGNASALDASVKGGAQTFVCNFDIHADGYQQRLGGIDENVIITGEQWAIAGQLLFLSGAGNDTLDYIVTNNIFQFILEEAEYVQPNSQLAQEPKNHLVIAHNTWINQRLLLRYDLDLELDGYCRIANNVMEDLVASGGATIETGVAADNHVYGTSLGPLGATNTSNGGDASSLFADAENGDFTPAGALLTSGRPPVLGRDSAGEVRKAIDTVGAIGSGALEVTEYAPPPLQTEWDFGDFVADTVGTGQAEIVSDTVGRALRIDGANVGALVLQLPAGTFRVRCTLAEWSGNGAASLRFKTGTLEGSSPNIISDSGSVNYFAAGAVDTTFTFAAPANLLLTPNTNGRSCELTKGADPVVEKIA